MNGRRPPPPVNPGQMNVPLQNAHILDKENVAVFEIRYNMSTGQSQMNISGNFPMHSLVALLDLTHMKIVSQMGGSALLPVKEGEGIGNGQKAGDAGNAQANPAEPVAHDATA